MTTTDKTEPSGAERAALEAKRGLVTVKRLYSVEGIEVRAKDDDSPVVDFYGHAAVTNKGYEMYGGPSAGGWTEFVDKGAFKRTLNAHPDVAFLINHTGMTLARTKPQTLRLREDNIGLEVKAELDKRQSATNDLVIGLERGDIDEMSFAFRVKKQMWLDVDGEEVPWWDLSGIERHLVEVDIHQGDVSVVNFAANPFTDAGLRSLDEVVKDLVDREHPDEGELRRALAVISELLPEETPEVDLELLRAERDRFLHRSI